MEARRDTPSLVRRFLAYGVHVALATADPVATASMASPQLDGMLPPGWRQDDLLDPCEPLVRFDLEGAASDDGGCKYRLRAGTDIVASSHDVGTVFRAFAAHAEFLIANRAPDHLFVHAGVVGWNGSSILMPGRSYAGKTTLVRAFLEAGATYYSDEYAVLDTAGLVHPYPRPLAIRGRAPEPTELVSAEVFGAQTGIDPVLVGVVLVTTYHSAARWRPRPLTPAQALLSLMSNTVAARGSPAHSMPILRQVVTRARSLGGVRGDAMVVVKDLVRRAAEMTDRTSLPAC